MKRYRVTATLQSPLVLRKERQSQRSKGADSISGTLLRGALAQAYLYRYGSADAGFRRLFLEEDTCRYGPLTPAEHVCPLTAVSCKRHSGFRDEDKPGEPKHGVGDVLWQRIARRLGGGATSDPTLRHCLKCGQDLKPLEGYWSKDQGKYSQPGKQWRLAPAVHVGIDRHTATAAEAMFYTLPTLEPLEQDARLSGELKAEDDVVAALLALLAEDAVIRVGHARTRGNGRVHLVLGESPAETPADWQRWSDNLIQFLAEPAFDPTRHFFFSLSLPAGAILLDDVLRYTLDPAGMVPWLPKLPSPEVDRLNLNEGGEALFGGRLH